MTMGTNEGNAFASNTGAAASDQTEATFHAPTVTDIDEPIQNAAASYIPEGYETVEEFLKEAREIYQEDIDADRENREAAMDDMNFIAIDPWDPEVRAARESEGKPVMTVNTLPQFIGQVIGDRRMNETQIRLSPKMDATIDMAEMRAGLIRNIEEQSRAERVYDACLENQVTCGIANFRIDLDYADDNVFLQDIFIRNIPNPLAVIWDRMSYDHTGRDADHCFVVDTLPDRTYEKLYPTAKKTAEFDDIPKAIGWHEDKATRVCEYWQMKAKPAVIALTTDGKVQDITGQNVSQLIAEQKIVIHPQTGKPVIRAGTRRYAVMHLITGWEILAGPYELPIDRLPIIRVEGRVIQVAEKRVRFGIVRWAKDPARMRNYWRSVAVEKLAMSPKAVWTAEQRAVIGREEDWRQSHISGDPLLVHNDNTPAPQRVEAPQMDAAILQETNMNTQDIKDVTGLQDASLGIRSNEVSGKAIMARQREGDVATIVYHDNLNHAILEGGTVVNQLLPIAYDTIRTLRSIDTNKKQKLILVNDKSDPNSIDLAAGKYDLSIDTGPSATTQRQFAAEAMLEAVKVQPELMQIAGDLIVKAQDWPGAQEIADRIRKTIPAKLLPDDEQPGANDPAAAEAQAQQQAQQQELQQQAIAMQTEGAQLDLAEKRAKVHKMEQEGKRAAAEADRAEAEARKANAEAHAHSTLRAAEVLRHALPPEDPRSPHFKPTPPAHTGAQPGRSAKGRTNQRDKTK